MLYWFTSKLYDEGMASTKPMLDVLADAAADYRAAYARLVVVAIEAHRVGTSANNVARALAGLQGFGRNKVLALLAADRDAQAAQAALEAAGITDVYATDSWDPTAAIAEQDLTAYLARDTDDPLDQATAGRILLILTRAGLTVDGAADPVTALADLGHDGKLPLTRIKT